MGELTNFTLKIMCLFLPGIISYLIIESLIFYKKKEFSYFIVYSFVLGFLAYFNYYGILYVLNKLNILNIDNQIYFFNVLNNTDSKIKFLEIFWVSILAVANAIIISYIINEKLFHKIMRKFNVTKKTPEPNTWCYIFDSNDTKWVTVRDIKNDLVFDGWVESFSDTLDPCELFIKNVQVYKNSTGDELYTLDGIYISRNKDDITIEFREEQQNKEA
ncbi:MAG: DUF6338 family protein [bacterium]